MLELVFVSAVLILAFVVDHVASRKTGKGFRRGRVAVSSEGLGFIGVDELDQEIDNIFVVDEDDDAEMLIDEEVPAALSEAGTAPVFKTRLKLRPQ